ncbi:MAG: hypothetical protein KGH72_04240 [Candidatus Micrarchaeota archaeon]|nr:hypothetical protein [Candidatus Micrarchaeota archaeon]
MFEKVDNVVAALCSSEGGLETMIEKSKRCSQGKSFVLLADYNEKLVRRLAPAYLNALLRHDDSSMRSSSIQIEMLLLLAGTMKINDAIRIAGAKKAERFIAFATDRGILSKFLKMTRSKIKKPLPLELYPDEAEEVAMSEILSEK